MTEVIDKVVAWLTNYNNILLVIHQNPDGDTIASSLALSHALKKLNKTVCVVGKDPIPAPFLFLPGVVEIKQDFFQGDWEVIVVMDCGDLKRTGFSDRIKAFAARKKRLINIDHHPKNDLHKISNVNYFDTEAAATGEMIARLIDLLNVEFDKNIATCLLTAIYTDTGGFKHSNTTASTLQLASRLMAAGGRLKMITRAISNSKSIPTLRLWGIVLSRIKRNRKLGLISAVITQADLKKCQATLEDLAGAVNLIGSVPETKAAILLVEQSDGTIKASLRTEADSVDVSKIAQIFGGGGHKKASGFVMSGKVFQEKKNWRIITN